MRKDYEIFLKHIAPRAKVLDIGCGEGEFLAHLKNEYSCRTYGIELSSDKAATALSKGLSVIHGDADAELQYYPSKETAPEAFDYVILADTLQAMKNPRAALEEARRISKKVLISIPNFGFITNRFQLLFRGKMPVTKQLTYEWYETPNIHFSTITDFIDLLNKVGFEIERSYYIDLGGGAAEFNYKNPTIANLFGKNGVFVLS